MEHEQRTIHEPSSSTSAYCSTLQELDTASTSVCTSVVRDAEESTSSRYWTSTEYMSDTDVSEGYVRVLPGSEAPNYDVGQIKLLEKIGEGGQGNIYTAQLTDTDVQEPNDRIVVAKLYKGIRSGQWPEDVFGLHMCNQFICQFYGYCLEGESFYLLMPKYDCSLRDVLDNQMKQGRALPDYKALVLIIQIALGMWFLHENNIIHRDLKTDNVFLDSFSTGVVNACIGDFDVSSNVVGTLFWRAPEVLQALKEGNRPVFTPKADVYSYAMTCYEILTGGVPLDGVKASDYDAVLQHNRRPKLPSNLNPKVKDLMSRCWHQDPEVRPTFKEIVTELEELHRELITGSKKFSNFLDGIFSHGRSWLDIVGASPETNVLELKALVQSLEVKYGREDFFLICLEVVADIEQYQSEFGLRSFKEHPVLPFAEWFAREKLHERIRWKHEVYTKHSTMFASSVAISQLLHRIMSVVYENYDSSDFIAVESESEHMRNIADLRAWDEECADRVIPEPQHAVCSESLEQACDMCRFTHAELDVGKEDTKSFLYVISGFSLLMSSLRERIRTLL